MRAILKQGYFQLRRAAGDDRRLRRAQNGGLLVLTAHQFRPDWRSGPMDEQPMDQFRLHLRFLRRNYRLVSLAEGLDALRDPERGRDDPRPMACLTVDDGFADGYELLFPELDALGIRATFFLATDFVDGGPPPWPIELADLLNAAEAPEITEPVRLPLGAPAQRRAAKMELKRRWSMLPPSLRRQALDGLARRLGVKAPPPRRAITWDQAREMQAKGQIFGSHTVYHSILPPMSSDVVAMELVQSKRRIESELQTECTLFAYPNGDWDERTSRAVERAGYAAGLTQDHGVIRAGDEAFSLKRINLPPDDRIASFACRVAGVRAA